MKELFDGEYAIPEGYTASVENGKIIVKKEESEDDKMKKEITELVMQPTWKTEKEFHRRKELCAWLEKQGEQTPADKKGLNKIEQTTMLETCEIEHIEHGKYYYCIKDYFCGGKKQASKGDVVQALRGMSMMALGVKANEYFLPVNSIEQKTIWSKEDELVIHNIVLWLDGQYISETARNKCLEWFNKHCIEFLTQPQPKQEWNGEDERLFQIVVDILDRENHSGNISHTDLIACVRKLKSLKKGYTWKPSEEQMKSLSLATQCVYAEEDIKNLESLYTDLKKI